VRVRGLFSTAFLLLDLQRDFLDPKGIYLVTVSPSTGSAGSSPRLDNLATEPRGLEGLSSE